MVDVDALTALDNGILRLFETVLLSSLYRAKTTSITSVKTVLDVGRLTSLLELVDGVVVGLEEVEEVGVLVAFSLP